MYTLHYCTKHILLRLKRSPTGWIYAALGTPLSGNNATHHDTIQAVRHIAATTVLRTK
jgi:hypothetical protein